VKKNRKMANRNRKRNVSETPCVSAAGDGATMLLPPPVRVFSAPPTNRIVKTIRRRRYK